MHVIYKPKYEVHDNFNFHITKEEIDTQNNDDNQLGQHESNVNEFSSVFFVKEYRKQEKDSDSQNIDQDSVTSNHDENNCNNNDPIPGCSHWADD